MGPRGVDNRAYALDSSDDSTSSSPTTGTNDRSRRMGNIHRAAGTEKKVDDGVGLDVSKIVPPSSNKITPIQEDPEASNPRTRIQGSVMLQVSA